MSKVYKTIHFWKGNESRNPMVTSDLFKNLKFLKKSQKFTFLPQFFCDNLEKNPFGVKKIQLAFHKEET